jgi:hypothetical protein
MWKENGSMCDMLSDFGMQNEINWEKKPKEYWGIYCTEKACVISIFFKIGIT